MHYDVFSSFYDQLTENVDYLNISKFIASFLPKGAITIDLGCGTGKLCSLLHDYGYQMIGVDSSEGMLNIANQKRNDRDILFLCQDMTELNLYGSIQGAVCVLDSLNHLPSIEDVETVIGKVSLFMEKDGMFVFDINTEFKHRQVLSNACFVYESEQVFCTWQNSECWDDGTIDISLDFFLPTGDEENCKYTRFCEDFSEILIPTEFVTQMLEKYRFELIGMFDDYSSNHIRKDTQRITFVARKKEDQ